MKNKYLDKLQQPVVIIVLFIVMIASLWCVLIFLPKPDTAPEDKVPMGLKDVRSGNQELNIKVLPEDGSALPPADGADVSKAEASVEIKEGDADVAGVEPAVKENVRFRIDKFQKLATQPLKFQLFGNDGAELTPEYLKSLQGEKVHFYLVHANLREFHHMNPEYKSGWWNASVKMPTPGTYYAYIAIYPLKEDPIVHKYDLVVREESPADISGPDPSAGLELVDGPRRVQMKMERLDSGRMFSYIVYKDEKPAALEPFIEAFGQLSIFKHGDPAVFVTAPSKLSESGQEGAIYFTTQKLTPGRYTAFAEIKFEGKIYVFPLTFDIGAL